VAASQPTGPNPVSGTIQLETTVVVFTVKVMMLVSLSGSVVTTTWLSVSVLLGAATHGHGAYTSVAQGMSKEAFRPGGSGSERMSAKVAVTAPSAASASAERLAALVTQQ
jgi:hypothetical protein